MGSWRKRHGLTYLSASSGPSFEYYGVSPGKSANEVRGNSWKALAWIMCTMSVDMSYCIMVYPGLLFMSLLITT